MQAVLLAGGLGTRLRSVVSDRPKPMALIEGKPFMEYVIRGLARHGITDIIFAVGYKGSMVEEHFRDGKEMGIHVSYAYEEELLGTAGAIKNAGKFVTEDQFFVLNADTFYQLDYSRLTALSGEKNLDMALVLREVEDVSRYGAAVDVYKRQAYCHDGRSPDHRRLHKDCGHYFRRSAQGGSVKAGLQGKLPAGIRGGGSGYLCEGAGGVKGSEGKARLCA